jgi:hypothetical protein
MTMTVDPRQTAADLRNASLIAEHAGLARGEYVSSEGAVCAEGAIHLATGVMLLHGYSAGGPTAYIYARPQRIAQQDRERRSAAAIEALAPLLSTDCAGRCSMYWHRHPAQPDHVVDAGEKVFHYNDFICRGGEELALLLLQAAEKLEAQL